MPAYAFWDTNTETLDLNRDKNIIIPRIFERGTLDDIYNFVQYYGSETVSPIMLNNKYLSRQSVFLASIILNIPVNKFKAYAILWQRLENCKTI